MPDFVTMLTTPPAAFPNCALKFVGLQAEFLQGVGIGEGKVEVQIGVVMPGAIELVIDGARAGR